MITKEKEMFDLIAQRLRSKFSGIYIISKELVDTPTKFPAVSITLASNSVREDASTFSKVENAASETLKVEAISNKDKTKKDEVKSIMQIVDKILLANNYYRIFYKPVPSVDTTLYREVGRWRNNILT